MEERRVEGEPIYIYRDEVVVGNFLKGCIFINFLLYIIPTESFHPSDGEVSSFYFVTVQLY